MVTMIHAYSIKTSSKRKTTITPYFTTSSLFIASIFSNMFKTHFRLVSFHYGTPCNKWKKFGNPPEFLVIPSKTRVSIPLCVLLEQL